MTTAAELDAPIEELTVDAYHGEEQLSGFLAGAEEAFVCGEQRQSPASPSRCWASIAALTHALD